jgi:hypothetical protein
VKPLVCQQKKKAWITLLKDKSGNLLESMAKDEVDKVQETQNSFQKITPVGQSNFYTLTERIESLHKIIMQKL